MWQPNRAQWFVIWPAALLLILAWPAANGRSLGAKTINWLVDPGGTLPMPPEPLPMGLDDNGDAVAAHDGEEREYYRLYDSSPLTRWRMKMKVAADPLEPATERPLLLGVAVLGALGIWQLNARA